MVVNRFPHRTLSTASCNVLQSFGTHSCRAALLALFLAAFFLAFVSLACVSLVLFWLRKWYVATAAPASASVKRVVRVRREGGEDMVLCGCCCNFEKNKGKTKDVI
jgi:hypothetical protein